MQFQNCLSLVCQEYVSRISAIALPFVSESPRSISLCHVSLSTPSCFVSGLFLLPFMFGAAHCLPSFSVCSFTRHLEVPLCSMDLLSKEALCASHVSYFPFPIYIEPRPASCRFSVAQKFSLSFSPPSQVVPGLQVTRKYHLHQTICTSFQVPTTQRVPLGTPLT